MVLGPGGSPVTVSVHQPNFMAWVKLLDKILASDVYVAYDTVQFTKSEYHNRQKIKLPEGPQWLTVPVVRCPGGPQLIKDVRIDNSKPFRKRHLRMLQQSYRRAPYFDEIYPIVERVYAGEHQRLVDLNLDLMESFCRYLGSPVNIVRASTLDHDGDNTERLVGLIRSAGGSVHLTSTYGSERNYIDWQRMQARGVVSRAQVFQHPVYDQPWGEFAPHLAAVDMLFCCGRSTARILTDSRKSVDVPASVSAPAETAAGAIAE